MNRFYDRVDNAREPWYATVENDLMNEVEKLSTQGFSKPYPGKDYLYARFSQKEPFDILYFSPAITVIVNLDDQSYTLTPELNYTGFTNWELQLKFALLQGDGEYGETKITARLNYESGISFKETLNQRIVY